MNIVAQLLTKNRDYLTTGLYSANCEFFSLGVSYVD